MRPLQGIEHSLINGFQHHFPCSPRPYRDIAHQLGLSEETVLRTLGRLQEAGIISRIGPVFSPGQIGCSTLAALAVPPERCAATAHWISALPEVNHNYEREDHFNLWFVITAAHQPHLRETLERIADACPFPLLTLPLLEQFHIDLGFQLPLIDHETHQEPHRHIHTGRRKRQAAVAPAPLSLVMSSEQRELVHKLQSGLPLTAEPYAALWPDDAEKTAFALKQIEAWQRCGVIKRFGIVVRHHELGYQENAMVVWDVPDAIVHDMGRRAATIPAITLCYRRPRQMPSWPYNLFCMIHGKSRQTVRQHITAIGLATGLAAFPMKILFSKRRFKQCGAHYVSS